LSEGELGVVNAGESMELTVIFPAYNEEESIRPTMERALRSLRKRCERFEIIIVDDCGRDRTAKIADELAAENPEIRVIHNQRNLGSGHSTWIGFQHARYDLITHDAVDYPFDLEDLDLLMPALQDADIVVAVRKQRAGYSAYRKLMSHTHLFLLHSLFDLKLRDYNFVQLYRKRVLETVKTETRSTAFLTPETMIRAHAMGYRIAEVDVEYHERTAGQATSGSPKVILRSVRDMLLFAIRLRLRLNKKDAVADARQVKG
jgi:dolichol-phosphate mannosyltransferase